MRSLFKEPENLFEMLDAWVERGWLKSLDHAFTKFLLDLCPETSPDVLLAAALTSHQLGRGHICLDLSVALDDPDATLSLPPEGEKGEEMPPKPSEFLTGFLREDWEHSLSASALVGKGAGNTPLVLSSGRLYMRRYWRYTQDVAKGVKDRIAVPVLPPENILPRLDELFDRLRTPAEKERTEVHWQSIAAAVAARSSFSVISGGPGTGKTTTVVQLLGLLQGQALEQGGKLRIHLAAPTGKAAARLTESIGKAVDQLPENVRKEVPVAVTTLHRLLGSRPGTRHFTHNPMNPLHVDLLVVDEASMIDLSMMAALLSALPKNARLILLGDKDQLASVEAGSVLGDLCRNAEKPGYSEETRDWIGRNTGYSLDAYTGNGILLDQHIVVLRKSHRFGENSGIGNLARWVNAGDPKRVFSVLKRGYGDINRMPLNDTGDPEFAALVLDGNPSSFTPPEGADRPVGYRAYLSLIKQGPEGRGAEAEGRWLNAVIDTFGRFQLLSALRKGSWGVEGLNERTAEILHEQGLTKATAGWYPGRPVLVTRNDYSLGLMNGDIGILLPVTDEGALRGKVLRVVFPMADGTLKKVLPSRLNDVETVYAMTVHKSQGSEFEHTAMVLPDHMSPVLTRELVYTGITRARSYFTLVTPRGRLLSEAVERRTLRASGLGELFD